MTHHYNALIDQLSDLKIDLYQKDFLLTWNQSLDELKAVLTTAGILEECYRENIDARVFKGSLAISLFRDKSTRTRFSFSSAASLLGLSLQDLEESKSQISHGETVRETANMISFLAEVIGIRDDLFLHEGHEYMVEVSEAIEAGFRDGVLPLRTAVVNLQCDRDHPTQSLADLKHLEKTYGSLDELRGKKIAMTWAYSPSYGKPLSVPQGIIALMTRLGMDVSLAYPEGYDLRPEIVDQAEHQAAESGGTFNLVHSMEDAFQDTDIVYPKSWAPYDVMEQRTKLIRGGKTKELDELEKECLANNAKYKGWECTEDKMKLTKEGKALYMHCLPADITGVSCEEGEVAERVFDTYRTPLYNQAEHKLYVIAAMIMLTRFEKPAAVLKNVVDRKLPRRAG